MELSTIFRVSALTAALALTGCGGDIIINEGDIDNSVGQEAGCCTVDNSGNGDNGGSDGGDSGNSNAPGTPSPSLSAQVSEALGRSVQVNIISGTITEDTTLTNDTFYALDGQVNIGNDDADSAVLTVEPGTVIFGGEADVLVVSRGSRIEAVGTSSDPIIMTSIEDVLGQPTAPGQWGGMVILGKAPSNQCPTDGSACSRPVEGINTGNFGGTDETDNSGTLRYVVLKNSGFELSAGNELNGITFGGVGSGTTVEYLQVHNSSDDGVEFFGGNVNVKHLVLTNIQDDSIDWDHGFRGKLQHVFVQQNPNATEANRIIEADNDGSEPGLEPQSNPTIANMTAIGNNFAIGNNPSEGIYLREGTGGQFYNVVVTGPSEMGECFEVEGNAESQAHLTDGTIMMQHSVMACTNGENFKNGSPDEGVSIVDLEQWFLEQDGNFVSDAPMIANDGQPMNGSPLVGAGKDASQVDGFFDATDYIGAFNGTTDWREGWAFGFGGGEVSAPEVVEGCPEGTTAIAPADGVTPTCELSGTYTADLTLTNNNLYALNGYVLIGGDNQNSATLTVEAGTTVFGRQGADSLVVRRGSKLVAEGTASAPIVFTSAADVAGEPTGPGQWGGMVLLGNAPNNQCPNDGVTACARAVEGVPTAGDDGDQTVHGGNDAMDNSGVLRYVRVQYAGFEVQPGAELNGITFASIGAGTTVEYVQVHQNADDGVEFFGGTVNAKYVVLTDIQDDSVDWDHGFQGKMQYVIARQPLDNSEANQLIEADNDGSEPNLEPRSMPMIANFTGIGNDFTAGNSPSSGVRLREGTGGQFFNFIIAGTELTDRCLRIDSESQSLFGDTDLIQMTNSVVACATESENFNDSTTQDWFLGEATNSTAAGPAAILNGVFTTTDAPAADLSGNAFFDNVDFVGAVQAGNDWTAGWTIGL